MSEPLPKSLAWFMWGTICFLLMLCLTASVFVVLSRMQVYGGSIDLNRADASDLVGLPDIGWGEADRIVTYRREHGDFTSFEEIDQRVTGIGPARREALRRSCFLWVRVPDAHP